MNATNAPLYQQLRTRLLQREAELRAVLVADDARALTSATGDAEVTDFKEIAAQAATCAVEDVQMARAAEELAEVVAALRRLDDESYGSCADCGEPVGEQRLLARPHALYCTACQAAHERSTQRKGPASSRI